MPTVVQPEEPAPHVCGSTATHSTSSKLSTDTADMVLISAYNCEGLLTALPYVRELIDVHIIFLAETWMSRSEECYLTLYVGDYCSQDCTVIQKFAMDLPAGAGAGRRHGGVAMVCRNRPGVRCVEVNCGDERLCGVKSVTI